MHRPEMMSEPAEPHISSQVPLGIDKYGKLKDFVLIFRDVVACPKKSVEEIFICYLLFPSSHHMHKVANLATGGCLVLSRHVRLFFNNI